MAMYENVGFCPNNSFLHCAMEYGENIPKGYARTRELLGDRPGYMVYTDGGVSYYGYPYVCDCLIGATGTMGIEIATYLQTLIPVCEYAKTGRMILCTDVINPSCIPNIRRGYDANNQEIYVSIDSSMKVFEDERYVCAITDEGDAVHMYFFRKVKPIEVTYVMDPEKLPNEVFEDSHCICGLVNEYDHFHLYVYKKPRNE